MAELQPFPGLRYDPAAVGGDVAAVLAPPFDVISPAEQEALYHSSPYNIIRVEYAQTHPDDTPDNNRYTRAAAALQSWLQGGQLRQDSAPAFYLVRHEFSAGDRRYARLELMAAVRLEPWDRRVVLPHEHTLPAAKADRLQLLRAVRTNISPVYCLYPDAAGAVAGLLTQVEQGTPTIETRWGTSSVRMWVISELEQVAAIQQALADNRLYIADGHHRYETALNYRNERLAQESEATGREAYQYVLMGLTAAQDPGLVLLPLHRLVRDIPLSDVEVLRGRLEGLFEVWEVPHNGDIAASAQAITTVLATESQRRPTLALYGLEPDTFLVLGALNADALRQRFMPPEWSEALGGLDVSVLHKVILEPMLNVGAEAADRGTLAYESNTALAISAVDRGDYQLAFLLHPTRVDQVLAVADADEKMPAKSTFFFPKLPTGIVLRSLEGTL